jgi:4-hydroxybenzoate polyprenyltransferase
MSAVVQRVAVLGSFVKFSHSVFALPFALVMLVALSRTYPVRWWQLVALIVCVVSARSAAMAFNRLVDATFDARNVRTQNREIPSGKVSRREAAMLVVVSALLFIGGAFVLGVHCGVLALPVLVVLLGYSYAKRFSALCHFILGLSLALAPGGVWYALTATWSWQPVSLMVGVLLWVAGFDILYACQDVEFDTQSGLQSVPARLGVGRARALSMVLHLGAVGALVVFGMSFAMGALFWCGLALFSVLIASQHIVIARRGLSCIDQVFFTRNGLASVLLFLFALLDRAIAL